MTLEKIIADLYGVKDGKMYVDSIIRELEEELRKQNAKKTGCGSALSACKRILKDSDDRRLQYPTYLENSQIVSNGKLLVQYYEGNHVPLENRPEGIESLDFGKIITDFEGRSYTSVELPELKQLSSRIKIDKASHKGEKVYQYPLYLFNDELRGFNMFYIEQCMIALGGKNLTAEVDDRNLALKISGKTGVAYILACYVQGNKVSKYTIDTL